MNDLTDNTPAWRFQVWTSFAVAITATVLGVVYLPVEPWIRGYLGIALLFTVGSTFTLAKTVRDEHEAKRLHYKIESAKAERILRDLDGETEDRFRKVA